MLKPSTLTNLPSCWQKCRAWLRGEIVRMLLVGHMHAYIYMCTHIYSNYKSYCALLSSEVDQYGKASTKAGIYNEHKEAYNLFINIAHFGCCYFKSLKDCTDIIQSLFPKILSYSLLFPYSLNIFSTMSSNKHQFTYLCIFFSLSESQWSRWQPPGVSVIIYLCILRVLKHCVAEGTEGSL